MKVTLTRSRHAIYRGKDGYAKNAPYGQDPVKYGYWMDANKSDPLWLRTLAAKNIGAAIDGSLIKIPLATAAISKGTILVSVPMDEVAAYSWDSKVYLPLREIAYDFSRRRIVPFEILAGRPLFKDSPTNRLFGTRSGKGVDFLECWLFAKWHQGFGSLIRSSEREDISIPSDSILDVAGGDNPEWYNAADWIPELLEVHTQGLSGSIAT